MQFADVIGHEHLKLQLQELVSHNRLSHAMIFIGKEGSGALSLALAFSTYLVDYYEKPEVPKAIEFDMFGEPMGAPAIATKGKGFELANEYIHPDVHYSFPTITKKTGEKPICTDFLPEFRSFIKKHAYGNAYDWLQFINAENKQGNITASECSDIIRKLSLKSYQSEYKILIMWMPEYLGEQGNVLLKLIEEPPANTLFILVAEDESRVIKTIISRCQTIHVPPIDTNELAAHIEKVHELDSIAAKRIAILSDGNYREAQSLLQSNDTDWHDLLKNWLNCIVLPNKRAALVEQIDEIAKMGRENQKQLLKYFHHLIHQSVRLIYNEEMGKLMHPHEQKMANGLLTKAGVEGLETLMGLIDTTTYEIERNVNGKIVFLALSIKIKAILYNKSIILLQ